MIIEFRYRAGHTGVEDWEPSDLHCPNCGECTVWNERGDGDYYLGVPYICTSCSNSFSIQGPNLITERHEASVRRLEVLKMAVRDEHLKGKRG